MRAARKTESLLLWGRFPMALPQSKRLTHPTAEAEPNIQGIRMPRARNGTAVASQRHAPTSRSRARSQVRNLLGLGQDLEPQEVSEVPEEREGLVNLAPGRRRTIAPPTKRRAGAASTTAPITDPAGKTPAHLRNYIAEWRLLPTPVQLRRSDTLGLKKSPPTICPLSMTWSSGRTM